MRQSSRALAALLVTSALSSPALGQVYSPPAPPPIRQTVDANGVDLTSGAITAGTHSVSIGPPGAGGMSWSRIMMGDGSFRDSTAIILAVSGSTYTVSIGGSSESFTLSGSNYVPGQGTGSTLTASGSTYTYTTRDGTVYTLVPWASGDKTQYRGSYRVSTITYPTGEQLTFNWEIVSGICVWNEKYQFCALFDGERLRSVTSTTGYQLAFTFQTETPSNINGPTPGWAAIATVQAQNMSVSATSQSWPTLTFTGDVYGNSTTTVADSLSRTTTYNYTTSGGLLTNVQRPGASSPNETVGWNTSNMVTGVTNNGVSWNYAYSTVGTTQTTTVTDANANTRVVSVDTNTGLVSSDKNELGNTTSYTYNSGTGLLNTVTAPEGNSATFTYDGRGNLTQTTLTPKSGSGLSPITTYASYPASDPTNSWMCASGTTAAACNKPLTTTDAKGNVTNYAWDSTTGLPTTVTLPAPTPGAIQPQTRFTYASVYGQYLSGSSLVNFATPVTRLSTISQCQTTASCAGGADEVKTSVAYSRSGVTNANALPLQVSKGAGNGSLTATSTATYDTIGNLTYVTDPNNNTSRTLYDADREVVGTISADPDGSGPLPNLATRLTYNADGQVTRSENGTTAGQSDSAWSGFSQADFVDTAYDANGRKSTDTLKQGTTSYALTQYSYDSLGRLQCSAVRMNTAVYGSLPSSACTQGTTGTNGPDQIAQAIYDAASELTQVQVGVGTSAAANERTLTYNPNGTVATLKDGMNNLTTYSYDGYDRLGITYFPSPTQGSGTSNSSDNAQIAYDANGNVTASRTRAGELLTYAYDALNRLTSKTVPTAASGAAGYTVNYGYDLLGRGLAATFASSGRGITNTYDALGRLTSSSSNMDGTARILSSTYDLSGNRTNLSANVSGYSAGFIYDSTNRMTAYQYWTQIGYDSLGRRSAMNWGSGSTTSSATYGYDSVNRLTSLAHSFAASSGNQTLTMSYDPASQIISRGSSNDSYAYHGFADINRSYSTNGLNQYANVGGANYSYDANGNLTSDGSNNFVYDAENKLVSESGAHSATLTYDPLGRLWQLSAPSGMTDFIYDGDHDVIETDGAGNSLRGFVWGPGADEPFMTWWESTSPKILHADERGSIISIADSNGNILATNSYDEYGAPGSTNQGRFQYTGQAYLPETGLYYYKARMYSPTLGRFLQTDPIGYGDGPNWYAYAHNDPVNNIDPMGLCIDGGGFVGGPPDYAITCPAIEPGSGGSAASGSGPSAYQNRLETKFDDRFAKKQGKIPCGAANQSGKGVLIKLGYTHATSSGAPIPGASHTFVMAVDPNTGGIFASRAGPGWLQGSIDVWARSASYDKNFVDYGSANAVQNVGYVNVSFDTVVSYMNSFAATTNANQVPYEAYTQNSNSYTAALLMGLGFRIPNPIQNVPGFGSNIPSPSMQCSY